MSNLNTAELHPETDWGGLEVRWLPLVRLSEDAKQSAIASLIGVDPADLSRFKKGQYKLTVGQFYALLKALKVKTVDESSRCLSAEAYKLITECPELAQKIMRQQPQLIWDDK